MPRTWRAPAASCRGPVRRAASAAALAALLAAGGATATEPARLDCAKAEALTAAMLPAERAPRIVMLQGSLGIVTMAPDRKSVV